MDRRERVKLYDQVAEQYDRARPNYPDDVIDEVVGRHTGALSVLDVGSGTGIASRQMAKRGAQVLGLDMSVGMSAVARRHGVDTEVVPFETWDPAERKFDVVASAQAWHWLDPLAGAVKAASVLRPGGRICLFWNSGFHEDELADALAVAYQRVLPPDTGKLTIGYAVSRSTDLPADLSPPPNFGVVTGSPAAFRQWKDESLRSFPWSATYTRDQWLDEIFTHTDHLALEGNVRQNLFEEIARTIDDFGGSFRMTFTTFLLTATYPG